MTRRVQLGILLAVCSFVYADSLFNNFTMDDELYIFRNPQVTRLSLTQLFQPNKVSAVFRPVTFATFAVNYKLNGDRPFGYHLLNLLLHAGVTMLLFLVLREILANEPRGDIIAFVTALLFAVHPLHTEAVASIVGVQNCWPLDFSWRRGFFTFVDGPYRPSCALHLRYSRRN